MKGTLVTFTVIGDVPEVQPGDELLVRGKVTVHSVISVIADLFDASTGGKRMFVPGHPELAVYANEMEFTRP